MSDIIKPNDLVDEATITRLEKLYKTIIDVKGGLEASLISVRDYLAMWKAGDSKSIMELNKAINESVKLQAELTKVGKEQLKAQQELEKLNALVEKTTREKNKAEAAAFDLKVKNNKEAERQNAIALKTEKAQKKAIADTQNINKQVRDLTKQLATMNRDEDPAGYDRIAKQAGVLKDQINDAKDAIAVFSKESKAATAKTLFGQIAGDIRDLDFAGAADKAKQFAGVIKSMTFDEVAGGIKNLGSAIGSVAKAFLANPFAIATAAVVALGAALYYFTRDADPAIVAAQDYTQGVKDMTDAIDEAVSSMGELDRKLSEISGSFNESQLEIAVIRGKTQNKLEKLEADFYAGLKESEEKYIEQTRKLREEGNEAQIEEERRASEIDGELRLTLFENARKAILGEQKLELEVQAKADKKRTEEKAKKDKKKLDEDLKKIAEENKKRIKAQEDWDDEITKNRQENDIKAGEARTDRMMKEQEEGEKNRLDEIEAEKKHQRDIENFQDEITKNRQENDKKAQDELDKQEKERRERVFKAVEDSLKRQSDLRKDAINKELKDREESIETQQRLAERGLENTLDFEKAAQAQAELRQEQQKRRELRRQKGLTYLKLVAAYADKGDIAATRKALVDIALSDAIAGSFIDGTEKVEDDLKGSKVHNGVDGYRIAVDGRERILNPEQNAMIGNMSNDELAAIGKAYNDGTLLPHYATDHSTSGFAANVANSILVQQLAQMNKKFDQMIQVTKNKRESSSHIDNAGNVITTDIENGFKTVTKKLRRKPRI